MTAIVWFRRDLRLHDNPAFWRACEYHDHVLPAFCLDRRLLQGPNRSLPRTRFMLGCLAELARRLAGAGSQLVLLRDGPPHRALPELAQACGAEVVLAAADVSPFTRERDRAVAGALSAAGRRLELLPGCFVVDDLAALRTGRGDPYTVFTAFHRRWLAAPRREPLPAPASLPPPPPAAATVAGAGAAGGLPDSPPPTLESLDWLETGSLPDLSAEASALWEPGERAAREAADRFLDGHVESYANAHDMLAEPAGTSRLSPYLHLGCISPRELESRLDDRDGPQALARQLCWRDFYAHVMLAHPGNASSEHQPRYRRRIRWSRSRRAFKAWCEGRTGYPLVDAAMRQLAATGWMHNRARMVAGSFLVKDLGIDWRWGERWFMRLLIDGDQASNNGNWQWIASVGVDTQPVSRRIFNPARQQQRFDPDGRYVRAHVPELARVPDRHLPQPWTMPDDIQRQSGCVIGRDYPAPLVDHAAARRATLERYAEAAASG